MAIGPSRRSKCRVDVVGYAQVPGTSEPLRLSEANNAPSHIHSTEVEAHISFQKFELCITCLLFGVGACMAGGSIVFYQTFHEVSRFFSEACRFDCKSSRRFASADLWLFAAGSRHSPQHSLHTT